MQKQSHVSGRETSVKSAMDYVLQAEEAARDAIRAGERRGAAIIADANEQVRRIEQRAADRIRRAHNLCADAVRRETRLAEERARGGEDPVDLTDEDRERVRQAADLLAAHLCGGSDHDGRGL